MSPAPSKPVTHVVFDVGNVLIEWDPNHLYTKLIPDAAERDAFLANVCNMEWNLEQDRGRSWADGIEVLSARHPDKRHLIEAYSERWHDMVPGEVPGSLEILKDLLASGVPVFAITNFSAEKWVEACERFPFLATSFRDVVVSAHEKTVKPGAEIYEVLLSRNDLTAEACVFIDDSPKNVAGAEAVGMKALHFTSAERLRRDLIDLGLPLAAPPA